MTKTELPPVEEIQIPENNGVPNHPRWPALIYRSVADASPGLAERLESRFRDNDWQGTWRWGVYSFHHFHSTAHEVLGVASGRARLRIGGKDGEAVEVRAGDIVLLPAGTGHMCLENSNDFQVVGAYPPGQEADLLRADEDLGDAKARIETVPAPQTDPFFGKNGPVLSHWVQ